MGLFVSYFDWRAGVITLVVAVVLAIILAYVAVARGPDPLAYTRIMFHVEQLDAILNNLAGDPAAPVPEFTDYAEIMTDAVHLRIGTGVTNRRWGPRGIQSDFSFQQISFWGRTGYIVSIAYSTFEE